LAEAFADAAQKTGLIKTPHGEFIIVVTTRPETMLGDTQSPSIRQMSDT
jgi:valyl-tRNA synthetase